jgi:hypothetical protein
MTLNIEREVAAMQRMATCELAEKYADVFGESTRSRHRQYLIKRIAWRMQANAEGDLTARARRRAAELANDADLRVHPPRPGKHTDNGSVTAAGPTASAKAAIPIPGTVIVREYKGRTLNVKVLAHGFEYDGSVHKSLSAVAKKITGSHINGLRFFCLGKHGGLK